MDLCVEKENEDSLRTVLKNRITMKQYFGLIMDILDQLKYARERGLQAQLQLETICIRNGKVRLNMYQEDSVIQMDTICEFIKFITFQSVFAPSENCQGVTSFLRYLDDKTNCQRVEDIYEYCVDQVFVRDEMEELSSNSDISRVNSASGETGTLDPRYWDQMMSSASNGETGTLDPRYWNQMMPSAGNGETGVLDPGYWNKLGGNSNQTNGRGVERTRVNASLFQVKSGLVTYIEGDSFWIGKENVDLILDKPTISRKHAVITRNENHFFISDNGSTNKTYVDNQEIPPRASVEIYNGTKIRLAKEEFEFRISQ